MKNKKSSKKSKKYVCMTFITSLMIIVVLFSGCSDKKLTENKFESMSYQTGECYDYPDERAEILYEDGKASIIHVLEIDCCAEATLVYRETEGIIRIYEDFSFEITSEECDCKCKKEITSEIHAKDISEIEFYSRTNKDYPYELLAEKSIKIN